MSTKCSYLVLTQTTPTQSFNLNPPHGCVYGLTIENLSLSGMTTTGTSLVLYSSDFGLTQPDHASQYMDPSGNLFIIPIGWVQPYPLPARTSQIVPLSLRYDAPRDIRNLLFTLTSNGTNTFVALQSEWLITLFHE